MRCRMKMASDPLQRWPRSDHKGELEACRNRNGNRRSGGRISAPLNLPPSLQSRPFDDAPASTRTHSSTQAGVILAGELIEFVMGAS